MGDIVSEIKFPKKRERKEPAKQRVVVCGTTSWKNKTAIKRMFKSLDPKSIECVITGTGRGVEQFTVSVAKELGILLYQAHPLCMGNTMQPMIVVGNVLKTFKPTLIIGFNEDPQNNTSTAIYQRLARRKDIEFRIVSKQ